VLTTGSCGTYPVLSVSVERASAAEDEKADVAVYLFNACEGLQRILAQRRVKARALKGVFFTREARPEVAGGLPGLHFSLADAGCASLSVRGPSTERFGSFQGFVEDYASKFVRRQWPQVSVVDISSFSSGKAKFETHEAMEVLAVTLRPQKSCVKASAYCHWCVLDEINHEELHDSKSSEEEQEDEEEDSGTEDSEQSSFDDSHASSIAMCYIIRISGKMHFNGREMLERADAALLAVVDCPSLDHATDLNASPHFQCRKHKLDVIFHLTQKEIATNDTYKDFLGKFGSDTRQYYLHESHFEGDQDVFPSAARWNQQLEKISTVLMPRPFISGNLLRKDLPRAACEWIGESKEKKWHFIEVKDEKNNEKIDETINGSDSKRRKVEEPFRPRITFLGTGAAKPSKLRNCSSILVEFASDRFALLDAGDATYVQLLRLFGLTRTNLVMGHLEWIWISHAHLDHHGGLVRIISECTFSSLQIFGPRSVGDYLSNQCKDAEFLFHHCTSIAAEMKGKFRYCSVKHCHDAFALGFVLEFGRTNLWIVYSGDTRPFEKMWNVLASPPSHISCTYRVLIHEATFEDKMFEQAVKKRHSTVGEALKAAKAMASDIIILTHFSQRYPKVINLEELPSNVSILFANDLMSIPLSHSLEEWKEHVKPEQFRTSMMQLDEV